MTIKADFGTLKVEKQQVRGLQQLSGKPKLEEQTSARYVVLLDGDRQIRADIEVKGEVFMLQTTSSTFAMPKSKVERIIKLSECISKLTADETAWYVVTLRDGSELRGKVTQDGDKYVITCRWGKVTVDVTDVFCLQKVDRVFINPQQRAE